MNIPEFGALLGPVLSLEVLNRLFEIFLKGTLEFLAVYVIAFLLKRQSAAIRARIWAIAFTGFLAVVVVSFVPTIVRLSLVPHAPGFGLDPASAPLEPLIQARESPSPVFETATPPGAFAVIRSVTWAGNGIFVIWGIGTLWCLGKWGAAQVKISKKVARSELAPISLHEALAKSCVRIGIRQPIRLTQSREFAFPGTWGLRKPIIILPRDADQWPRLSLGAVLDHELAHIRRWDFLVENLARGVAALLWFHPGVWISLKRLSREREQACDDAALENGAKPSEYATLLLKLAASRGAIDRKLYPELAISGRDGLPGRLAAILGPRRVFRSRRGRIAIILAMAAMFLVGVATVTSFWREDGRMGQNSFMYWKNWNSRNQADLAYDFEKALARGGWTAAYAQLIQSSSREKSGLTGHQVYGMGIRLLLEKKYEESRAVLRWAMSLSTDAVYQLKTMGEKSLHNGRADIAIDCYNMALSLRPEQKEEIGKILANIQSR